MGVGVVCSPRYNPSGEPPRPSKEPQDPKTVHGDMPTATGRSQGPGCPQNLLKGRSQPPWIPLSKETHHLAVLLPVRRAPQPLLPRVCWGAGVLQWVSECGRQPEPQTQPVLGGRAWCSSVSRPR